MNKKTQEVRRMIFIILDLIKKPVDTYMRTLPIIVFNFFFFSPKLDKINNWAVNLHYLSIKFVVIIWVLINNPKKTVTHSQSNHFHTRKPKVTCLYVHMVKNNSSLLGAGSLFLGDRLLMMSSCSTDENSATGSFCSRWEIECTDTVHKVSVNKQNINWQAIV